MKKQFVIKIEKPCSENWHQMDDVGKKKFCASCEKQLYDFSYMTDAQIMHILHTEKKVCGRFSAQQLNRKITLNTPSKTKQILGKWAAGLLLVASSGLNASCDSKTTEVSQNQIDKSIGALFANIVPPKKNIQIKIVDENVEPLSNVLIESEVYKIKGFTDKNGILNLDFTDFIIDADETISIIINPQNNYNYETLELKLNVNDFGKTVEKTLSFNQDIMILGEPAVYQE